jgi:hypothetical protein
MPADSRACLLCNFLQCLFVAVDKDDIQALGSQGQAVAPPAAGEVGYGPELVRRAQLG